MPQLRPSHRIEPLETRVLLTLTADPTAQEQYWIELINRARANPAAEAARDGVNLNEGLAAGTISTAAKQPLALNPILVYTARSQSNYVLQSQVGSHAGAGGTNPGQRMTNAGYDFVWPYRGSENIAWPGASGNLQADADSVEKSLFIDNYAADRGHRINILDPVTREIGTGFAYGKFAGYNAIVGTMDTALTAIAGPFLTGVVYTDSVNHNHFYDIGEGIGGATIIATNTATHQQYKTTSYTAGGYSLALPNGTYSVTAGSAKLGGTISGGTFIINGSNVKMDFVPGTPVSPPPPPPPPTAPSKPTPFFASAVGISATGSETIQAENFDNGGEGVSYHDTDNVNQGGAYRAAGVDIQAISGGDEVSFTRAGEWMDYAVNVASAGKYNISVRISSSGAGGQFHCELDSTKITNPTSVPNTGSWTNFQNVTISGVQLSAGQHELKLAFDSAGPGGYVGNFDSFTITPTSSAPTGTAIAASGTTKLLLVNFDNGAEGVSYHDTDTVNQGGLYRNTGVDIGTSSEGGYDIGWVRGGEWLSYTLNIAQAGNYALAFRVANPAAGGAFHVEVYENNQWTNVSGAISVPDTGNWNSWTTVNKTIALPSGLHAMRVVFDTPATDGYVGNFNWVTFVKG